MFVPFVPKGSDFVRAFLSFLNFFQDLNKKKKIDQSVPWELLLSADVDTSTPPLLHFRFFQQTTPLCRLMTADHPFDDYRHQAAAARSSPSTSFRRPSPKAAVARSPEKLAFLTEKRLPQGRRERPKCLPLLFPPETWLFLLAETPSTPLFARSFPLLSSIEAPLCSSQVKRPVLFYFVFFFFFFVWVVVACRFCLVFVHCSASSVFPTNDG